MCARWIRVNERVAHARDAVRHAFQLQNIKVYLCVCVYLRLVIASQRIYKLQKSDTQAATPIDRLARYCRIHLVNVRAQIHIRCVCCVNVYMWSAAFVHSPAHSLRMGTHHIYGRDRRDDRFALHHSSRSFSMMCDVCVRMFGLFTPRAQNMNSNVRAHRHNNNNNKNPLHASHLRFWKKKWYKSSKRFDGDVVKSKGSLSARVVIKSNSIELHNECGRRCLSNGAFSSTLGNWPN